MSGGALTLDPGGSAMWQPKPDAEGQPARWLCMQDGPGEITLPDGAWRMARDAISGETGLSTRDGRSMAVVRAP